MSASKAKKTDTVEKDLHPNWVVLIKWCGVLHQNGPLTFETQGAVPMEILKPTKEKKEFGKESAQPLWSKEITPSLIRVRVTRKWAGLIQFCVESFPYGQVSVQIAAGEPTRPIERYTKAKIRFDHPESFPTLVRFYGNPEDS